MVHFAKYIKSGTVSSEFILEIKRFIRFVLFQFVTSTYVCTIHIRDGIRMGARGVIALVDFDDLNVLLM